MKIKVAILSILIFCFSWQTNKITEPKVIDCKIVEATSEHRLVSCDKNNDVVTIFSLAEWPNEWVDSTKSGQIVKIQVYKEVWAPFPSCEARRKATEERLTKAKKNEFKLPLQLPIDKDCQ